MTANNPATAAKPPRLWPLMLLLLITIGAGAVLTWKHWQLEQQVKHLQHALVATKIATKSQQQKQQQLNQNTQKQTEQLATTVEQLDKLNSKNWQQVEAAYLLRLAHHQAKYSHDASTVLSLLNDADTLLKKTGVASSATVRQQIAHDRKRLLAYQPVNTTSLYLRIDKLAKTIDTIKLVDLKHVASNNELIPKNKISTNNSFVQKVRISFQGILKKMGGYIRIQSHRENNPALLKPQEQVFIKQNLRIILEKSQLALLQNNQEIYRGNLNKAKQWLSQYFVIDEKTKSSLLIELDSLANEKIFKPLPKLSALLPSSLAISSSTDQVTPVKKPMGEK